MVTGREEDMKMYLFGGGGGETVVASNTDKFPHSKVKQRAVHCHMVIALIHLSGVPPPPSLVCVPYLL